MKNHDFKMMHAVVSKILFAGAVSIPAAAGSRTETKRELLGVDETIDSAESTEKISSSVDSAADAATTATTTEDITKHVTENITKISTAAKTAAAAHTTLFKGGMAILIRRGAFL